MPRDDAQETMDLFFDHEKPNNVDKQAEAIAANLPGITGAMIEEAARGLWVADAKRGGADQHVIDTCWPRVKVYNLAKVKIVTDALFPQEGLEEGST